MKVRSRPEAVMFLDEPPERARRARYDRLVEPAQECFLTAACADPRVPARGVLGRRWGSRKVSVTNASHSHVVAIHLPMTEGAVSMAPFGRTFGSQGWEPRAGSALEGPPICRRTYWRHQRTHVRVLRSRGPPKFGMSHVLSQFANAGGHGADRANLVTTRRVHKPGKRSAPDAPALAEPTTSAGTPPLARFACPLRSLPGSTRYVPLSGCVRRLETRN